jgi:hypothetical protein
MRSRASGHFNAEAERRVAGLSITNEFFDGASSAIREMTPLDKYTALLTGRVRATRVSHLGDAPRDHARLRKQQAPLSTPSSQSPHLLLNRKPVEGARSIAPLRCRQERIGSLTDSEHVT